ncbi:MAG: hypothetical protein HQK50_05415 [Oligoflexia bacterium]|nr:hypothetical protein [Oligoflexia bacterium]
MAKDIAKWNKEKSSLSHVDEFRDRFIEIAKIYCGKNANQPKCKVVSDSLVSAEGVVIKPGYLMPNTTSPEVQSDLSLIIGSTLISQKEATIDNFKCVDGVRSDYLNIDVKKVRAIRVVDPFSPDKVIQEEGIKEFPLSTNEAGCSFFCHVYSNEDTREPVCDREQIYQVVDEEQGTSPYIKIGSAGECSIVDEITGICKVSTFPRDEGNKETYKIRTLKESETNLFYETESSLTPGVYSYNNDGTLQQLDDKLFPTGNCQYYLLADRPKDAYQTPALVLKNGVLKSSVWKGNRAELLELDVEAIKDTVLKDLDFTKNALTELTQEQCDFAIQLGAHQPLRTKIIFKPAEDRYFKVDYVKDVPVEKRINDFSYHTIINSIDFEDRILRSNLLSGIKGNSLPRLKQIVLSNWEQLDDDVVLNLIKQRFVGLQEIKIKKNDVFPQQVDERSKKLLAILDKIESALPLVSVITPPVPVKFSQPFPFTLGKNDPNRLMEYYYVSANNSENYFFSCLSLKSSTGAQDISCLLIPNELNKEYSITYIKKSAGKDFVMTKSFVAKRTNCKIWNYKENTGYQCGVEKYNSKEDIICGYQHINTGTGPECGIHHYLTGRGEVCGVENYKDGKNMACGADLAEVPSLTIPVGTEHIHNVNWSCQCRGYDPEIGDWTEPRDGYRILVCGRIKSCRHPENGVERHKECAHPTFGIVYNNCQHTNFGFKYKTCEDERFGAKTYKSCRHPDFGQENCKIYED